MPKNDFDGETAAFSLPSGVSVEIRELDGSAEKALTDRQELKTGVGLDRFMLKSLVSIDGNPPPENEGEAMSLLADMRTGDRNYLLLRIRMLNYGDEMIFNSRCPNRDCGKTSGYQINLQELLDDGTLKVCPYRRDVPIIIETRGGTAEVDYMTGRTERWLAKRGDDIDPVCLALAACKRFNGGAPAYEEFEKLHVRDLAKIRLAFMGLKGGLDPRIELDCPKCGLSRTVNLYEIPDFFSPLTTSGSGGR